ncbi:MAG TPA: glycine betaine ABC transporter substrate-binding protein [Pseudonocardia sp.]|jgi:osmoprotectant transport system substrate-binding protein|uniref:ABC transporter substrate-binding protein n=1 Tax=Pseudonocardia sp. TaxID=60912 RepID=UPI002F3F4BD8
MTTATPEVPQSTIEIFGEPGHRHTGARVAALLACLLLLLATTSCSASAPGTPVIVIGTKEFTEQWVIGELWAQALREKGLQVEIKNNVGSTTIIDRALSSGSINLYPEYTGVILQVLAKRDQLPSTAAATYDEAKQFEETRGLTLMAPTPFQNTYAVAVKTQYAKANNLKTISDLARLGPISYAEYPDNMNASSGYAGLLQTYGLHNMKAISLTLGLQYDALDADQVQAADVFTTDPQLARSNLTLLEDTKNIFGYQNVAPVIAPATLRTLPPEFTYTLNRIDALLTVEAIRAMNRAVSVNRLPPDEVARRFLAVNKLL